MLIGPQVRRRATQPQGPVGIDWSNPLTRGLVFLVPAGPGGYDDVVGRKSATVTGVLTRQAGVEGRFPLFSGTQYLDYPVFGPELTSTTPATIAWMQTNVAGSAYSTIAEILPNGSSTGSILIYQSVSDSNYYFAVGPRQGSIVPGFNSVGALPDGRPKRFLVRTTSNLLSLTAADYTLFDGQSKIAAASASAFGGAQNSLLRIGARDAGSDPYEGTIGMFAVWNRALSDAEALAYNANPWQIFRDSRPFYLAQIAPVVSVASRFRPVRGRLNFQPQSVTKPLALRYKPSLLINGADGWFARNAVDDTRATALVGINFGVSPTTAGWGINCTNPGVSCAPGFVGRQFVKGGTYTIIVIANPAATSAYRPLYSQRPIGGGINCGFVANVDAAGFGITSGKLSLVIDGTNGFEAAGAVTGKMECYGIAVSGTASQMYRSGTPVSTTTVGTPGNPFDATQDTAIGYWSAAPADLEGQVVAVAVFDGVALPDAVMREYTRNIWQLFAQPAPQFFLAPPPPPPTRIRPVKPRAVRQPQNPPYIDYSSPLAKGLIFLATPHNRTVDATQKAVLARDASEQTVVVGDAIATKYTISGFTFTGTTVTGAPDAVGTDGWWAVGVEGTLNSLGLSSCHFIVDNIGANLFFDTGAAEAALGGLIVTSSNTVAVGQRFRAVFYGKNLDSLNVNLNGVITSVVDGAGWGSFHYLSSIGGVGGGFAGQDVNVTQVAVWQGLDLRRNAAWIDNPWAIVKSPAALRPFYITGAAGANSYSASVGESITLSEAYAAIAAFTSAQGESVTLTNTVAATAAFQAAEAESLTLTDASTGGTLFAASIAETITLSDVVTSVAGFISAISESITTTDASSSSAAFVSAIAESASLVDAAAASAAFVSAIAESITPTDAFTGAALLVAALAESLTLTPATDATSPNQVGVTESITLSVSVAATAGYLAAWADAVTLGEVWSSSAALHAAYAEAITLSDSWTGFNFGQLTGNARWVIRATMRDYAVIALSRRYTVVGYPRRLKEEE